MHIEMVGSSDQPATDTALNPQRRFLLEHIQPSTGDTTSVLKLQNRYSEMEARADWLQDLGRANGLADGVVQDLNLALEEVVKNVISYAYGDDAEHEIVVRAAWRGDQLEV